MVNRRPPRSQNSCAFQGCCRPILRQFHAATQGAFGAIHNQAFSPNRPRRRPQHCSISPTLNRCRVRYKGGSQENVCQATPKLTEVSAAHCVGYPWPENRGRNWSRKVRATRSSSSQTAACARRDRKQAFLSVTSSPSLRVTQPSRLISHLHASAWFNDGRFRLTTEAKLRPLARFGCSMVSL